MIGTSLSHYRITEKLGQGGMGEVYRAEDTNLSRQVAIKVLPDEFAHDAERLARFEREAKLLASLNHPNIAAIHGLEEHEGKRFLVLELVEGQTLAERLKKGRIPLDETLDICRQIAEGLEAAHEKGIIHRDLKPANVKVTPEGKVKILDFGLAKAFYEQAVTADMTHSPTITDEMTRPGVVLGTAAYMSPEQAKGKAVDKRADIWAFGCIIYECLTAKRAFAGETITETLAAILRGEPNWQALPETISPAIRRLLLRCLKKDTSNRFHSAADVRIEIEEARAEPEQSEAAAVSPARLRHARLGWISVILVCAIMSAFAGFYFRSPAQAPEMRLEINTPPTSDPSSFAISPDGRKLVFAASDDQQQKLWLRLLDADSARPLPGSEGASYPFWSPDSGSVAFFANGKLKRTDIGGVLPRTLADAAFGYGGSWGPDGIILFSSYLSPIFRVSAAGGAPVTVTKLAAPNQTTHCFPCFLPGGRQFLFLALGAARGIYLGSLDSPEVKLLTDDESPGAYLAHAGASPGWLLFRRQRALLARRFDLERGELIGDPVTLTDSTAAFSVSAAAFSVSATGLVAYRSTSAGRRQLTWFDRSGKVLGTIGPRDDNDLLRPEISPDGLRVAMDRTIENNTDVWLLDSTHATRFTFDAAADMGPVWSPDGSRIVFVSARGGTTGLYQKPSSGAGSEERLPISQQGLTVVTDWSADGRFLLCNGVDPGGLRDLWVLPLDGRQKQFAPLQTTFDELNGQFSPDGHWVAYHSNESGTHEVYVRPFPGPGGQWQVSTSGGIHPRWRRDSGELYYIAPDAALMAVPISVKGTALEPGTPVPLFQSRVYGGFTTRLRAQYDVAPDGRFLINVAVEDTASSPITLLLNWKQLAR